MSARRTDLRVVAEVEGLPVDLLATSSGDERLAVRGVDQPALDLELRDTLDRVVLLVGEAAGGPGLPVGRRDDQRCEEQQREERDAVRSACSYVRVRPVGDEEQAGEEEEVRHHRRAAVRHERQRDPGQRDQPVTPPMMMNVCSANPNVRPAASSFEKPSSTWSAIFMPRATKSMKTRISAAAPISPSSCASAE